jgi:hypothetical protein
MIAANGDGVNEEVINFYHTTGNIPVASTVIINATELLPNGKVIFVFAGNNAHLAAYAFIRVMIETILSSHASS